MPSEVLYRLPEWSMYIETPSAKWFDESMHGFWVHLEFDMNTHRHELRLLLNTASTLVPVPIHIGNWTLTEAVDRAISESKKYTEIQFPAETAEKMAENLYGLVSLVLYVCSEEPEIDDLRTPGEAPSRPQPTKTKKGWKLFPAKKVKIWTVGKEASKAIRSFNEELQAGSTGSKVRPHVRRAHWHGYWTGKRGTSEQRFIYKWIPALIINVK
ncbi:hypothetical protein M3894_002917 [Vibrio metschnikovii]|nr:hypothetical protein [Vibrio metschnikovii]